jgi:mono/diheme cytochrome c family protein
MRITAAIGAACALLAAAGAASAQTAAAPPATPPPAPATDEPPPGPGLDLIQQKCVSCHALSMITSKRKTPDEWAATVETMAGRGAEVSPDEMDVIVKYLAKTYPAAGPSADAGR